MNSFIFTALSLMSCLFFLIYAVAIKDPNREPCCKWVEIEIKTESHGNIKMMCPIMDKVTSGHSVDCYVKHIKLDVGE